MINFFANIFSPKGNFTPRTLPGGGDMVGSDGFVLRPKPWGVVSLQGQVAFFHHSRERVGDNRTLWGLPRRCFIFFFPFNSQPWVKLPHIYILVVKYISQILLRFHIQQKTIRYDPTDRAQKRVFRFTFLKNAHPALLSVRMLSSATCMNPTSILGVFFLSTVSWKAFILVVFFYGFMGVENLISPISVFAKDIWR